MAKLILPPFCRDTRVWCWGSRCSPCTRASITWIWRVITCWWSRELRELGKRVHGGLPMVLLERHRGADRLERLCAVPFGEFTQNLFQTRDQVSVMQQTLYCRRPYDYRRFRHGRFDWGWPQTSQRYLNINTFSGCQHFFPSKNFISRQIVIPERFVLYICFYY